MWFAVMLRTAINIRMDRLFNYDETTELGGFSKADKLIIDIQI